MTQTSKVKIAAGHYQVGEYEVVKESASYGEDTVWHIYRGEALTGEKRGLATSLADAVAWIGKQ